MCALAKEAQRAARSAQTKELTATLVEMVCGPL